MVLRRTTKFVILALAVVFGAGIFGFLALVFVPKPVESWLQGKVLAALQQRYGTDVQLENLQVSVVPIFRVTLDNFVLPNKGPNALPPFLTIKHITAEAFPLQLVRKSVHLSWVKLDGMVINVPPKGTKARGTPPANSKKRARLANFEI